MEHQYEDARLYDSKAAHKLASHYSLKGDLFRSKQHLETILRNDCDELLGDALFTAAVVGYARCFNRSSGRTVIQDKEVRSLASGAIDAHNMIMGLRNGHFAHFASELEQSKVAVFVDKSGEIIGLGSFRGRFTKLQKGGLIGFVQLIEVIIARIVEPKIQKQTSYVENELEGLSVAERLALPVAMIETLGGERATANHGKP